MTVNVCLVQDSPVFFDKERTIEKIEDLTAQYARQGSRLIVFPESFIPGYPRGFLFGATIGSRTPEGRELYAEYHRNSVDVTGPDMTRLTRLARSENVYLVVGFTEKSDRHGSLYCSMAYISPTAGLLGVHRKIKPTGTERLIWAEAGGDSLVSFQTEIGKLGGLICWENYMPLARVAMYQQGVEIYLAPTADSRDSWTATLRHIALEGRCFVLGCNQFFTKDLYSEPYQKLVTNEPDVLCSGGSVIVSPMGEILAGPLFGEAGTVRAELDMNLIVPSKLDFDVIGHYARPDIFEFTARGQPDMRRE